MNIKYALISICCFFASAHAQAGISFKEVTQSANMVHAGQTYGASWGDFDGDGWPDLWVGNHNSKPSLYLNKRDGSFENIIDDVWSLDPSTDTHGAAWVDFDNDGDQDLVELVGALKNEDGTFCFGCGRNHLFLNDQGMLVEKGAQLGLDSVGLARSPLWFDADWDGRLDLLVVNTGGGKRLPTSTLFYQGENGFEKANEKFDFKDDRWSRRDQYLGLARNALRFRFDDISLLNTHKHMEFSQLMDIDGEGKPELVLFSVPSRVYSISEVPFDDDTAIINLPALDGVSDVAIEDFNGDGKLDMYLTLGPHQASDVIQVSPGKIKGSLAGHRGSDPHTVRFRTKGPIEVEIYPTFLSLSKVYIGAQGEHPKTRSFSLSSDDSGAAGPQYPGTAKNNGVSITYDAASAEWVLSNASKGMFVDFIISAPQAITDVQRHGFTPYREEGVDVLLTRQQDGYVQQTLAGEAGADTTCHSVAAGDFDNDMDVDLFLVCTGPVENLPNRLLENDGKGNFHLVADAGGASGSALGRGDIVATADYDRDGFLDLFISNGMDPDSPFIDDGPHQLFHNQGNDNHWLEIDLEGVKSNRDGIGATVVLEAGGVTQIREQRGGMHRITQNHQRLHFGLGKHSRVDRLTVRWPSGVEQVLTNVPGDRIVNIREAP